MLGNWPVMTRSEREKERELRREGEKSLLCVYLFILTVHKASSGHGATTWPPHHSKILALRVHPYGLPACLLRIWQPAALAHF